MNCFLAYKIHRIQKQEMMNLILLLHESVCHFVNKSILTGNFFPLIYSETIFCISLKTALLQPYIRVPSCISIHAPSCKIRYQFTTKMFGIFKYINMDLKRNDHNLLIYLNSITQLKVKLHTTITEVDTLQGQGQVCISD